MEYTSFKFPVKNPYIKVKSNRGSSHGSVGSPNDLSYSYSCIKAFTKNQNIIKNLTSLQVNNSIQGQGHDPLLYSLSGDREKPICGPFYYSTSPAEAKNNNYYSTEKIIQIEDSTSSNLKSEYEPIFSDKRALLDWLKDQVKYVNVLRSFSKSSYISLSKFFKCKNQDVKMEMLLNNIDDETKTRLKRYLNELNLDLEERCTLFNESTIEIDITPIMADKSKFQAFLSFLKTIDPSVYNTVEGNVTQIPGRTENKTPNKYICPPDEMEQGESSARRNRQFHNGSADRISWQHSRFQENKDKLSKRHGAKPKHTETDEPKVSHNYEETSGHFKVRTNSPSYFPKENSLKAAFERGDTKPRPTSDHQPRGNNDKFCRKPRATFEPTLAAKQRSLNSLVDRKQADRKLDDLIPSAVGQSNASEPNCTQTDSKLSCKCLIHLRREDYSRYRNQCLFGKGDETSNNFLKYLADKERESRCQVHTWSSNEEGYHEALEIKQAKDEALVEFEDEYASGQNQMLQNKNENKQLKRASMANNKLNKTTEKDCTSKTRQTTCYKTNEKIRVNDVETLMYSINYNENNYNCFDNNLGLPRSNPASMRLAEEEPDACFESLSYDVTKLKLSANLTCAQSKSDTHITSKNAPSKFVSVKDNRTKVINAESETDAKAKEEVNQDTFYHCNSIKPSRIQEDLETSNKFDLRNKTNPSVQILHCNKRLQNCIDDHDRFSSEKHLTFNDGIHQSSCKVLPNNEQNVKIKARKSLQIQGASDCYASKRNSDKHSLQTNYSRRGSLDKMSEVIKMNKTNYEQAKPRLKELKTQRTHLSLNSLKPKNLYRNISTVLKRKSSTNSSNSEQTMTHFSKHVSSFSEDKLKSKIKEAELTQHLNLKPNNRHDGVYEKQLASSDASDPQVEIPTMLTELLDRVITELKNQRIEIKEMKKLLDDKKNSNHALNEF